MLVHYVLRWFCQGYTLRPGSSARVILNSILLPKYRHWKLSKGTVPPHHRDFRSLGHLKDTYVSVTELRPPYVKTVTKNQGFAYMQISENMLHSKDFKIFSDSLNISQQVYIPESRLRVNEVCISWEYLKMFLSYLN